jgi:hypothetical protein
MSANATVPSHGNPRKQGFPERRASSAEKPPEKLNGIVLGPAQKLLDKFHAGRSALDMRDPVVVESLRRKYQALRPSMDERLRRNWAAAEALELQWGGLSAVAEATGLSLTTIRRGVRELHAPPEVPISPSSRRRIRHPGGGRKTLATDDPALVSDLERLSSSEQRLSGTYVVTAFGSGLSVKAVSSSPYIPTATSKSHSSIVRSRSRSRCSSTPPRRGRESTA